MLGFVCDVGWKRDIRVLVVLSATSGHFPVKLLVPCLAVLTAAIPLASEERRNTQALSVAHQMLRNKHRC